MHSDCILAAAGEVVPNLAYYFVALSDKVGFSIMNGFIGRQRNRSD